MIDFAAAGSCVCTLGAVATGRSSGAPETSAPFSADASWRVLEEACREAGLDGSEAVLLRLGENAIYGLAQAQIVVRIARRIGYWDDAAKEVAVARWLAEHDVPAAAVAGPVDQPVVALGHPVTFWRYINGRVASREVALLGGLLRQLHELPSPTTFDLPALDILGRVEERVDVAPVPGSDKAFLLDRLVELRERVAELRWPLAEAVVHGDAHDHNVMIEDGRPLLIDFERFAWGQPEWDLAVTATEYQTGGWWSADEYATFVEAYGFDVTNWDGWPVVLAVNELKMTTWIMQNIAESGEIADEYEARMHTLRTSRVDRPWRPF